MSDEIVIRLPAHAARYLAGMCMRDRDRLAQRTLASPVYSLHDEASFDSLNAIECAFPAAFWTDAEP